MKSICFDIGHMNTTGAFPSALPDGKFKVERLAFEDKDLVINSQIVLTNDQMRRLKGADRPDYKCLKEIGPFRIGNKLSAYVQDGEKFSYFKVAPKYFDEPYGNSECARQSGMTHGKLMACYVFALMESVFKYNSDNWNAGERAQIQLLVGCPSTQDWVADSERKKYEDLVKRATDVQSVRIVPESRGAMFSCVEKNKASFSAMNGAAVFDFGSSTADFTYMLMGRKVIEFSWTLGAGKIEEQMAMEAYRELIAQRGAFQADESSVSAAIDQMRPAKEAYYDGIYGEEGQSIVCKFREYLSPDTMSAGTGKAKKIMIDVDSAFMDRITAESQISILCDSKTEVQGSWQDLCRSFFQAARTAVQNASYTGMLQDGQKAVKNCEVHSIILTGGASRMPFIGKLAREVFPESDVRIFLETNPSHTVSNGLAWVAVSDERVPQCKASALEMLRANEECSVDHLNKRLSDTVYSDISDILLRNTKQWADAPGDALTVRQLQTSLQSEIESPQAKTCFEQSCTLEITRWKDKLSSEMEKAVNAQTGRLFTENIARGIAIPQDIWQELQAGSLDVSEVDVSKMISELDLNGFTRKLGTIVAKIIIWVIALAGATVFFPVIVVGILGSMAADAIISDKDLDKPRTQKIRKKVAKEMEKSINKSRNDIMKDFDEGMKKQTGQYNDMIDKTLTAAFEVATLKRFEL